VEDAARWAEEYNVTFPILIDPSYSFESLYGQDNYIPSFFIIEPGLNLVVVDEGDPTLQIGQYLP